MRKLVFVLATVLAAACAKPLEPGLYRVRMGAEEAFLRVGLDSLGADTALFYRNSGRLTADTLLVAMKAERGKKYLLSFPDSTFAKVTMSPYQAPDFHRFADSDLYVEPRYVVGETQDVVFGRVLRSEDGEKDYSNLLMDLYYPKNDGSEARPLLMTFHGGSFLEGDKRDASLVEWNRYFASLGYVVSCVNYRVGYRRNRDATDEAMYRALRDANAAVRFVLKRDSLRVHSGRIFAAGEDAGAITALNLAYFREENFPEIIEEDGEKVKVTRPPLVRGFDIRAVANLWGAVPDTAILHNAEIPVISFQDQNDPVIPFGEGYPFDGPVDEETSIFKSLLEEIMSWFLPEVHPFRTMYGAGEINRILKDRGVQSELITFDEEWHDMFQGKDGDIDYPRFDVIKEQVARFFASKMETSPVSLRQDPEDEQLFIIDKSEVDSCQWHVEGGVIIGKSDDTIRVLLFPDAAEHSVSVSGSYTSGLSFYETLAL